MITIDAKKYDIKPGEQIGKKLSALFSDLQGIEGEKLLCFEKGEYFINNIDCDYVYYAITNTVGKEEFQNPAEINMHYVPFNLVGISDLTIDGSGSTFIIDGKVTNMAISKCENVTVKNLKIDTINPNVHKLTVKSQTPFSVTFELNSESVYEEKDNKFTWVGSGYSLGFMQYSNKAFWTASIKKSMPHKLFRTSHPFMGAVKIKKLSANSFKTIYPLHKPFERNQTFYVFDAMRSDVGIFLSESKNIVFDSVAQYFNYSLAYVAQDCTNLTLNKLHFAPKDNSTYEVASLADFIQICMCSGDVNITNSYFNGAADDALNVHGVHFEISNIIDNKIEVKFRHPQTWGFNPLHEGDRIEFIDKESLLCVGENKIVSSELIDDYTIVLELESAEIPVSIGGIIEDIDRCPNVNFTDNFLDRIITRGLLLTTRGKTVVKNNRFVSTTMSGILHSDDAKNWYESGMVKDVLIENNTFDYCGGTPILILPENRVHNGAVHQNIEVKNNTFKNYKGVAISIKSTKNIVIQNNKFKTKKNIINQKNCENLQTDVKG